MTKIAAALAVVAFAGGARADTPKPDARPSPPDPLAQQKADEANLETDAPRQGVTFSLALGGGLLVAKGSVGSMPLISLRLGHVMTPDSILTLEVAGGALQHKQAMSGPTLVDSDSNVLVGAQYYTHPSVWLRAAGGLNLHTIDNGTMARTVLAGGAAAVGAGVDLVRRHFLVLDLEILGVGAVNRDGLLVSGGLSLGLSYY